MRELYSDEYASVAGEAADRLIPEGLRRLAGAAVFLGLIVAMALWAWRLGTRDAAEVPVIRAMEGAARIQPADPGGQQAAHQGLEVNGVLAGQPVPRTTPAPAAASTPTPAVLAEEDGPQGELVLAAPAPLPEAGAEADADLRMPMQEDGLEVLAVVPAPDLTVGIEGAPPTELDMAGLDPAAEAGPRPRGRPANLVVARARTETVASAAAPAAAKPKVPDPAAAAKAPAPAATAAREVAGLPAGTRLVQLGAFDSEAITRKAWASLVAANGDLLGSKRLYVERATSNARVFYRLRVAGFGNTEETRVTCEALKARGVDCIPVTLH